MGAQSITAEEWTNPSDTEMSSGNNKKTWILEYFFYIGPVDIHSQLESIFSYLPPLRSEMTISEMSSIHCPIPS